MFLMSLRFPKQCKKILLSLFEVSIPSCEYTFYLEWVDTLLSLSFFIDIVSSEPITERHIISNHLISISKRISCFAIKNWKHMNLIWSEYSHFPRRNASKKQRALVQSRSFLKRTSLWIADCSIKRRPVLPRLSPAIPYGRLEEERAHLYVRGHQRTNSEWYV